MDFTRFSLEGRTAIVTGGSGGIGRGCARALAQAGANIVIASVPPASIPPAVEEVAELGAEALGIAVDVSKATEVEAMVRQTLERFGRIDILVNVAGGSYSRNPFTPHFARAPLAELSEEDFMGAFEVNVKGSFLCAQAVVARMKAQGKGVIINTGSLSALNLRRQGPELAVYAAAKAALHTLTIQMAYQWGPEVRVNCIAPGSIETPRPAGTVRPELATAAERIAVGRVGTPDDIGGVAAFLASDAAAYINAAVIPVHGGV